MKVLDLFCGAGGASVGLHTLGMDVVGVDHDADACRTHAAAGWPTIRADLANHGLPAVGSFDGVWASPPCTAFSMAGKGEGRDLADRLIADIDAEEWSPWSDADPTIWLILPTMDDILRLSPEWVCMENVPPTRPVMEACARVLSRHGWWALTCVLSAETFGVAQTRKRCFLIASRAARPAVPQPTHQSYRHGEAQGQALTLFGDLAPWVSMAEALGWGTPERPYWAVPTAGGNRGGADEQVGGSGARAALYEHAARESWQLRMTKQEHSAVRAPDQPGPTIAFGHDAASAQWVGWGATEEEINAIPEHAIRLTVAEAARLQAFPHAHPWHGTRTSRFRQVGNAVPPPLAAAVAAAAAGVPWGPAVADYLADLYAHALEREDGATPTAIATCAGDDFGPCTRTGRHVLGGG